MPKREFVQGWEARLLILLTAVLVVFGLAAVHSASSALIERGRPVGSTRVMIQLAGAAWGGLLLLVAARVNLDRLRQLAWPMIGGVALLLVLLVLPFTQAIAPRINGSRRWLDLGVSIQVSELAKLAVVIWTAMLCARKGTEVKRLSKGLAPVLTIVLPLAGLVLLQPDLSTAITLVFLAALVVFAAGARIGHFIFLGALTLPFVWSRIERVQYQLLRLTTYFDPGADRLTDAYQIDQSLIAVGSGGVFGVGFGQGQQRMGFLPYPYSDFIFSTIAEEWGFIGVTALIGLFLAFILVALRLARQAGDPFRQYLGVGCAAMIGTDAFLHMAVGVGIVPTTGLVLPFISYGRSSLVVAMIATGLLINLGTRRRPALA